MCRLAHDCAGNTIMLVAAALLPLLALVGGGVDIGRGYLAQSRLQQACDAGVLAARKRLGSETVVTGEIPAKTALIGDRFFKTNFREASYGSIDREFEMTLEEDYSITGVATVRLPTTIMGIFGEEYLDVSVDCSAQLNYSNTDIMMVLDTTGSMATVNPSDTVARIDVLKDVIRSFHAQLSATALAGSRIRFGFVPYSTNVNVGHLLEDEWVVSEWGYQSRKLNTKIGITTRTFETSGVPVSGTKSHSTASVYPAVASKNTLSCPTKPADTVTATAELLGQSSELVLGPPPGTRTTKNYRRTSNGVAYNVSLDGTTCTVTATTYKAYVETYDEVTEPAYDTDSKWVYDRIQYDVAGWRTTSNGCIEERQTYEITDYDNVDFNRALDLNLDLVPSDNPAGLGIPILENLTIGGGKGNSGKDNSGNGGGNGNSGKGKGGDDDDDDDDDDEDNATTLPSGSVTKWRPMFPELVFARELEWDGKGKFHTKRKVTSKDYVSPMVMGMAACPPPATLLAEWSAGELDAYLDALTPRGNTYHDIGMIWGGRLISPTGLFAANNADATPSSPTNRNLIFLTDGETAPLDVSYGAYGVEPLDERRWSSKSKLTLTQTVEKRFEVACREVRRRGVTVWVIGFGTDLNQIMKDCAGEGHFFEAADAAELNASFAAIAKSVSELRIVN